MNNNTYFESVNGYLVEVELDEWLESPRELDNLGKWVCAHRRYSLPNEIDFDFDDFDSWGEVGEALSKQYDYVYSLYMYDHSALSFNLCGKSPYWQHAAWDAGQVGYVVANKSDIRKWFGVKKVTKKIEKQFFDSLEQEVKDFQAYANGEIYEVRITDEVDGELIDFCSGFYSAEEALESGKETAEGYGDRQLLLAAKEAHPELVSY